MADPRFRLAQERMGLVKEEADLDARIERIRGRIAVREQGRVP
jgi:hypothetical protein